MESHVDAHHAEAGGIKGAVEEPLQDIWVSYSEMSEAPVPCNAACLTSYLLPPGQKSQKKFEDTGRQKIRCVDICFELKRFGPVSD